MTIHSGFPGNCQKLETTEIVWLRTQVVDKTTAVHPFHRILLSNTKGANYWHALVFQKHYAEWKKVNLNGHILHDSIYLTFSKHQNDRNDKQIICCQGLVMVGGDL